MWLDPNVNSFDHDVEIHDIIYDNKVSELDKEPVIYFSDVRGQILKLNSSSLREEEFVDLNRLETMGNLTFDDHDVFFLELGSR